MPSDPKEVHVQLFLHPGDTNGDFHFETGDLPMTPTNVLHFNNCGHPGFLVHYDIQGTNDYVFPDAAMTPDFKGEALYCHANKGCPTGKSNWGQFTVEEVINGGKTLVILNKNNSSADFAYTLRVTKDNGAKYLPLDPGGVNGNGPSVKSQSSTYTLVAVGAVAGSLLTLGAQALNLI